MYLTQLLLRHFAGSPAHEILCIAVHGEGDDLTDVILVPNIQVGNILGKSITIIAQGNMAGFVVGAQVPIVFCSRGSSAKEKFLSLALAAAVSAGKNK